MVAVKVHFGAERPKDIDYRKQVSGIAECWLYRDVHEETDADGNSEFVAEGVFIETMLTEEEVQARRESYFEEPKEDVTVGDLVEALDILTNIVLGSEV